MLPRKEARLISYSYCNSIVQCLYFSPSFRERMLNYPDLPAPNGHNRSPIMVPARSTEHQSTRPGPLAMNSPARRPIVLPGAQALAANLRPDEKDSPEYKKKMLMQTSTLLDMQTSLENEYGMDESLFTALKDIFQAIMTHSSRTGIVSPHRFLEILRRENEVFRNAMHQDAHEFMNLLLNQVLDSVDLYNKKLQESSASGVTNGLTPRGWVHDLFEGLLVSETRCLTCETVSQRDEAFMDLSVDLQAHSSVTSCLRKFSEEEMLCERNKFYCDNCNGLQEAEKRMKIKRLPKILALHLKRFEYTEDYGRLQKLFHRVSYPFHLRLFNTTDDAEDVDRLYELYAVVVHIGGGPYHGHYVSIIKTQDRGWLLFDDELVEPVDKSYVQNFFGGEPKPPGNDPKSLACAYVLFYQETTEDAVLAEEEAERRAEVARTSTEAAATVSNTASGGLWSGGLWHMHSNTASDAKEESDRLAQAATSSGATQPADAAKLAAATLGLGGRVKRDTRKEEKAAEKERKAFEKEADKLAKARRKEEGEPRNHLVRPKSQGDLATTPRPDAPAAVAAAAAVTEESERKSADAATAPPGHEDADVIGSGPGPKTKRTSSISLRQRFWSSGRTKEKDTEEPQPGTAHPALSTVVDDEADGATAIATAIKIKDEKDAKRNRFSLAKKRSTNV